MRAPRPRYQTTVRLTVAAAALVLAACGRPAAPPTAPAASEPAAELAHATYTVGGDAPTGLLVALHYSSGTPAFWQDLVKDWRTPVRVLAPQGPRRHEEEGYTWFPADHEAKDAAGKTADVVAVTDRVAALIRSVRAAHPEIRRVAVTGFSYGGDLAWMLVLRHPDLVDVAVPMGTRLLGDPTGPWPAGHAVRVLQGETDAIIDARATAARVAALAGQGVAIDVTTYPGLGHDMSPALIADWTSYLQAALAPR
jgi:phospholipase/carboxylesterase